MFSTVAVSTYISTNSTRGFPFSTSSPAFIACRFFEDCHSDLYEVIPHCSFDLHFYNNWWYWAFFFMCLLSISLSSLNKCLLSSSVYFWLAVCFSDIELPLAWHFLFQQKGSIIWHGKATTFWCFIFLISVVSNHLNIGLPRLILAKRK